MAAGWFQAMTSNRWPFGSRKNTRPWPPKKSLVSMFVRADRVLVLAIECGAWASGRWKHTQDGVIAGRIANPSHGHFASVARLVS